MTAIAPLFGDYVGAWRGDLNASWLLDARQLSPCVLVDLNNLI